MGYWARLLGQNSLITTAEKGRGVAVEERVLAGQYVLEYSGDTYPRKERKVYEEEYSENGEGCFILEVQTRDGWICIDPTRQPYAVCRLLNHAPPSQATLVPFRPLKLEGKWRVGFVAARDLFPGEELIWDYSASPSGIEWLKRRPSQKAPTTTCKLSSF